MLYIFHRMGFCGSFTWLHSSICCDINNSRRWQYTIQSKLLQFPFNRKQLPWGKPKKKQKQIVNCNFFSIHYRKYEAQFNQIYMNVNFVVNIIVINMIHLICKVYKKCLQCIRNKRNPVLCYKHRRPIVKQLIHKSTTSKQTLSYKIRKTIHISLNVQKALVLLN